MSTLFTLAPELVSNQKAHATSVITLADNDALVFNRTTQGVNIVGDGTHNGDIVLYKGVGTFSGITIDCAVTTTTNATESTISAYDNPGSATTTTGYLNNFMINMNTTASTAVAGGESSFTFSFYEAGTYTAPNTGIPVVLRNVRMTSIDLDSSGTGGYQYTDFTGFQKYSLMSPTNLAVNPIANSNRVRFIATKAGARSSVPEDQVLIKYDSMSSVTATFGNPVESTTNYYGIVFGAWPSAGTTPVELSLIHI